MTKLTWKRCGNKYYDKIFDYLEPKFKDVEDYKSADKVCEELKKMTPEEISVDAGNTEYNVVIFHKEVMFTAYQALWKFYQI